MVFPGFKTCPHHDHYQYSELNKECPLCEAERDSNHEMTLGEILPLIQGKTIKTATTELDSIVFVFTDGTSFGVVIPSGEPIHEGIVK